jgi:excisionase family DNA binding protein
MEEPMELITIKRAAEISGISPNTLRQQVRKERLRTVKPGHDLLTTRTWLHEYLTSRDATFGKVKPLPPDYVAPGEE